jgi:peptide subunit release factor RF-3
LRENFKIKVTVPTNFNFPVSATDRRRFVSVAEHVVSDRRFSVFCEKLQAYIDKKKRDKIKRNE